MIIPTKKECIAILKKNKTPSNVIKHSKAVCRFAEKISDKLTMSGVKLNKKPVIAAALLHDIERAKQNHVIEGAKLLKKMGFPDISRVVSKHSLHKIELKSRQPKTLEEKIVFYADKRVMGSKIVSLEKRFKALEKYYKIDLSKELEFTKKIGKELLGNENKLK